MLKLVARKVLTAMVLLSLTGCFGPEGTLRIKTDKQAADLYINGELVSQLGTDYIELVVDAGSHQVKVSHLSEDEEWLSEGAETVSVPEDGLVEKYIRTERSATEKRIARLALEKKQAEAKRLAKRVEAEFKSRMQEAQ